MNSETVMKQTVTGISWFLNEMFGPSIADQFNLEIRCWPETWNRIREWLRQTPMHHPKESLLSFAQTLPQYESFRDAFENSLVLHEEFWNKVFTNFKVAQKLLEE